MNEGRRTLNHSLLLVTICLHIHIHISLHNLLVLRTLKHRLLEEIGCPRGRPCGACNRHGRRVALLKVHRQRRSHRGEVKGFVAHECGRSGICAVRAEESRCILVL